MKELNYLIAGDKGGWWPAKNDQVYAYEKFVEDYGGERCHKIKISSGGYYMVRENHEGQSNRWIEIQDRVKPYKWRTIQYLHGPRKPIKPISSTHTKKKKNEKKGAAHLALLVGRNYDRILLLRHKHGKLWGTPGGEIDIKKNGKVEEYFEAMKREFKEETGAILPQLFDIRHLQPYSKIRLYVAKTDNDLRSILPANNSLKTTETDKWAIPKISDVFKSNSRYPLRGGVVKGLNMAMNKGYL